MEREIRDTLVRSISVTDLFTNICSHRQIRNAFQAAIALVEHESQQAKPGTPKPALGKRQFQIVSDGSREFDRYMYSTFGATEADIAIREEWRADRFASGQGAAKARSLLRHRHSSLRTGRRGRACRAPRILKVRRTRTIRTARKMKMIATQRTRNAACRRRSQVSRRRRKRRRRLKVTLTNTWSSLGGSKGASEVGAVVWLGS